MEHPCGKLSLTANVEKDLEKIKSSLGKVPETQSEETSLVERFSSSPPSATLRMLNTKNTTINTNNNDYNNDKRQLEEDFINNDDDHR